MNQNCRNSIMKESIKNHMLDFKVSFAGDWNVYVYIKCDDDKVGFTCYSNIGKLSEIGIYFDWINIQEWNDWKSIFINL